MIGDILTKPTLSRRGFLRVAAAGAVSLSAAGLLAACGDDAVGEEDDPDSSSGSDAQALAQAPPTQPLAESESSETAVGGDLPAEFIVANIAEPTDLLPWFGGYETGLITRQIYQTLVEPRLTVNDQGVAETELVPQLAEQWELIDDTRWRFTLRQGVTFHNGEPFNAEAVITSLDALTDPANLDQFKKTSLLRDVTGWEAVDDHTVDITTAQKNVEFPNMWLRIGFVALPPKLLAEQGMATLGEHPVGTGPYQFESWTRGQELRLTKFEEYWKGDEGPNMPVVRYIVRPEAAVRAQTIAAGEAHFAYNIGMEQATTLENYVVGGGFQSTSLRVNNTIEPTSDIRVRKALNYAIDRQAIVEAIFGGAAVPLAFFGFQPVDLEPYPYDPEQAASLIQEAGIEGTELELVYGEGRIPEEDQLAEIYVAAFEAIGLKVKLNKVEPRQYDEIGSLPFKEQPTLYMETTSSGNFGEIAGGLLDKYGCEGTGAHCDPALDAEFKELLTIEGPERLEKLQSIAERLHEKAPRVWVATVQQVHGLAPNVETDLPANTYILFDDIRFV